MSSKDQKEDDSKDQKKQGEGDQHNKAQDFKNSGNDKFKKNNYKGAISDYKKGLLHEPSNCELHSNLSAAYIHLEKYIEAEEHALFAIHLRPTFYKGYTRAAKAAHGKGMTRLALKRLASGLEKVTDQPGLKELNRLKTQYTAYLSLASNAEREMTFDSDTYQSEDDSDGGFSDDGDSDPDMGPLPEDPQPQTCGTSSAKSGDEDPIGKKIQPNPPMSTTKDPVPYVLCGLDCSKPVPEEVKKPTLSETSNSVMKKASHSVKEHVKSVMDPFVETGKKREASKDSAKSVAVIDQAKTAEKDTPTDKDKNTKQPPEKDKFLELCKTLSNPDLPQHVAEFKDNLKAGSEAFLSGNFKKAAECYRAAKERDYEIEDRQFQIVKYAYCASLINLESYNDIVKAVQELRNLESYHLSIPALYILLAKAYLKLNRFKNALEPLEKLQEILDNFVIFPTFTWPGTDETIQETTPSGLKNAIKELKQLSKMQHKPTAVCRFNNCLKISTHILPSELIYINDPDFVGYVRLMCEEKCHIDFHISCWKAYKESVSGVGKIIDKDMLGRHCLTMDCVNTEGVPSVITTIEVIDPDGQVKATNRLDTRESVDSKKAKKRKVKLDDKEKVLQLSKTKKAEKKSREVKKPTTNAEGDEETADHNKNPSDPERELQSRKVRLQELRKENFGMDVSKCWDPSVPFYGREDETVKATANLFLDSSANQNESVEVKDAKEFLFSYFAPILKEEGPLKQSEVEELWKESAGNIFDIKTVLPNLKSMCDLLLESTRFCQLEDYICLSDQLDEAYSSVKMGVSETVAFMMTGSVKAATAVSVSQPLPDLLSHPQPSNSQMTAEVGSDDESSESTNTVSDGSDESEVEESGNEEDKNNDVDDVKDVQVTLENIVKEASTEDSFRAHVPPVEPVQDHGRISLQEMLNEMSRVKSAILGSQETDKEQKDAEVKDELDQHNETFETAHGSSADSKPTSPTELDELCSPPSSIDGDGNFCEETIEGDEKTYPEPSLQGLGSDMNGSEHVGSEDTLKSDNIEGNGSQTNNSIADEEIRLCSERDKASQSSVQTKEKHIQTVQMDKKDGLSQTKESDLFKDLNRKLGELSSKLATSETVNKKLVNENNQKDVYAKQLKTAYETTSAQLQAIKNKLAESQKKHEDEISKKEFFYKQKTQELQSELNKVKEVCTNVQVEFSQVLRNFNKMQKDCEEVNQKLQMHEELENKYASAVNKLREYENQLMSVENNWRLKLQKTQLSQLLSMKSHLERQIFMLKNRCVEKISEMQNWFSTFPSEEVESLPSYPAICQNLNKWSEVSGNIRRVETEFLAEYSRMEAKIGRGEVEDLSTFTLPMLPEEPSPLPMDKITKEMTEKHVRQAAELTKKVSDLTQLVVNQQLEIEKSKEANQQIQQLMNSFQMVQAPRMQTPMSTAFGGLAMQYNFPPNNPAPTNPLFGQTPSSTLIPPPIGQETQKTSSSKPLLADVQKALQESSKALSFGGLGLGKLSVPEESKASGGLGSSSNMNSFSFTSPPPLLPSVPPPTSMPPPPPHLNFPPPPIGVAQTLLKASVATAVKEEVKLPDRAVTPKTVTSRESTPAPTPAPSVSSVAPPTPTPEKTKKKKKNKSESRDTSEPRLAAGVSAAPPVLPSDNASAMTADNGEDEWSVVGVPKAKPTVVPLLLPPDTKLKNKKRLLDKLCLRFPTVQVKDLEDIVKLVREQNNGSLSGLPFDEIEARVERFVSKRHLQKSSTMGLVKFTASAWGTMKQPEKVSKANIHLEECVFCLEPMGNDRTRIDCNHEFHTQCLRTWFKEKRICPLCQKFAAMPDEFPAL